MRRLLTALAIAALACLVGATPAFAHGLVGRTDLPIPQWLFAWAAAIVLVVSFLALAVLWPTPRLEGARPRRLFAIPCAVEVVCGAVGVALFALLVYVGFAGSETPTDNALPTFVYVLFWVGLVPLSVLLGDVFRAFSPWRAIGRAAGWTVRRVGGEAIPPPLEYPERLGRWPALVGLVAFGWLELVSTNGDDPSRLAVLAIVYSVVQLFGMSLYGVEAWARRGDSFGVYFGMFAHMAPLTVRDRALHLRPPLSGLTELTWLPGTIVFVCAIIGITAFDGAAEGAAWASLVSPLQDAFGALGLDARHALEATQTVGLLLSITLVAAIYRLGIEGMRSVAHERTPADLARTFAHSLVPIALAYILAHYFSLLLYQGQATGYLISDPLGDGSDLFGTAASGIDYNALSATAIWYVQVACLVLGHVMALVVAHERALVTFKEPKTAVRSQYWMLAVMVGFTSLGLWLLSEANG